MGKTRVQIMQISGLETDPIIRLSNDIPLNDFIDLLTKSREDCEKNGYSNLGLFIWKENGNRYIDMYIYGDRDFNESEIKERDEIAVILRGKPLSNEGLTRDEILERNSKR